MDSSESTSLDFSVSISYSFIMNQVFLVKEVYSQVCSLCRYLLSSSVFAFKTLLMKVQNQMVLTIFDSETLSFIVIW